MAVELDEVHRGFGSVRAVDGVSLRLRLGETAAILGPDGAGKTTTIDMVLGLSRPDQGHVRVPGLTPTDAVGRAWSRRSFRRAGCCKT